MGEETDETGRPDEPGDSSQFRRAVEARLQAELGCAESDAERVAAAVTRARETDPDLDWSPAFVAAKLLDAPRDRNVPEKWNWLLERAGRYLGTNADLDEHRIDDR